LLLSGKWPWSEANECIGLLVNAGAGLSVKDDERRTPLHYLAGLGTQNPLFFLHGIGDTFAKAKVDSQPRDKHGDTPLHLAARSGTRDVFDWLAKQGGDLDATNHAGETPRLLASRSKSPFASFGALTAETDIFEAARQGKLEAVSRLLAADNGLANQTNQWGRSPLRVAGMAPQTNMIELLEKNGAQWDEVSASMAGRADVLREILQRRPVAISTTDFGTGLLHIAVERNDT